MPYQEILGIKIHFIKKGTGIPVILLHGMGGSIDDWTLNIEQLSSHFTVYALDLPGFGDSPPPEQGISIDIGLMVELLKKFMDAEMLGQAVLCGQSMGGGIAAKFAIDHKDRVTSLILVDSACMGLEIPFFARLQSVRPIHRLLLRLLNKVTIQRMWESMFFAPVQASILERKVNLTWEWINRPGVREYLIDLHANTMSLSGQRVILLKELADICVSVLVIWGVNDNVLPLKHGKAAIAEIKDAEWCFFDNCGHIPQIEQAQKFNEATISFIQRIVSS